MAFGKGKRAKGSKKSEAAKAKLRNEQRKKKAAAAAKAKTAARKKTQSKRKAAVAAFHLSTEASAPSKKTTFATFKCGACSKQMSVSNIKSGKAPVCVYCGEDKNVTMIPDPTEVVEELSPKESDQLADLQCSSCGTHNIMSISTAKALQKTGINCGACGEHSHFLGADDMGDEEDPDDNLVVDVDEDDDSAEAEDVDVDIDNDEEEEEDAEDIGDEYNEGDEPPVDAPEDHVEEGDEDPDAVNDDDDNDDNVDIEIEDDNDEDSDETAEDLEDEYDEGDDSGELDDAPDDTVEEGEEIDVDEDDEDDLDQDQADDQTADDEGDDDDVDVDIDEDGDDVDVDDDDGEVDIDTAEDEELDISDDNDDVDVDTEGDDDVDVEYSRRKAKARAKARQRTGASAKRVRRRKIHSDDIDIEDVDVDSEESPLDEDNNGDDAVESKVTLFDVVSSSFGPDAKTSFAKTGKNTVTAFVNGVSVASAKRSDLDASRQELFATKTYFQALANHVKVHGFEQTLDDFAFAKIKLNVKSKAMAALATTRVEAKAEKVAEAKYKEVRKEIQACLGIAAAGLNRGFWRNKPNELKDSLISNLEAAGVRGANKVVAKAFAESGDSYAEHLIQQAFEIFAQPVDVRNSLSKALTGIAVRAEDEDDWTDDDAQDEEEVDLDVNDDDDEVSSIIASRTTKPFIPETASSSTKTSARDSVTSSVDEFRTKHGSLFPKR